MTNASAASLQADVQGSRTAWPALRPDPAARYDPFPLSVMQEAYWVGREDAFGGVADHSYIEVDCEGTDLERLERAWQEVVERHDQLRAVVLSDGRQRVLREPGPYRIEVRDLRGESPDVVAARLQSWRDEWSHEVRPSGEWPLFAIRATLCDRTRTRLHFSLDGLLLDGLSFRLVLSELASRYLAIGCRFSPLAPTFRDYVVTERALRESAPYQRSRAYWQARLPELPAAPSLPLAREVPHERPRFVRRTFELAPATWAQLKARGARLGLTPTGILLAAYADVLAYWSESPRLTISVSALNRLPLHPQISEVVGNFASFGLLGVEASRGESFGARAERLQRQLWQDLDHRYVSGVDVVRELVRQRGIDAGRMPVVFTSTLGLGGRDVSEALGTLGRVVYRVTQTPQVWLDALVSERASTLVVDWDVVDMALAPGVAGELFEAYRRWVERLATEDVSWTTQGRHSLLPPATRAQRAASQGPTRPVPDATLGGWIARRVALAPDAIAVVQGERRISYDELSRRAQGVAEAFAAHGVQTGDLVAVALGKSWAQAVAVVGVVSSGAAYVPLDPRWPPARQAAVLAQSGARVVVTTAGEWLARERGGIDVEQVAPSGALQDHGGELAYVLYTSGTTGTPKGVAIETRGVVNAIASTNETFGVSAADRVLAVTALTHDMSVYDVFGVLAAGGRVVLPEMERTRDPAHWWALLHAEGITIWNSVPTALEMLLTYVEAHGKELPASWRLALLGGDWVSPALVERLRRHRPGIEVVSVGGPTETTLWNIWHRIDGAEAPIPYGRPIPNTRYEIVNEAGEPCPAWVKGEMWCSGVGVMRGYWRDEARTQAAFGQLDGDHYYRTGDVGFYRPDGTIVICGRKDLQVKVRGYRVEVEEIEAVLRGHDDVQDAAVTVEGSLGAVRLVAYVELRPATFVAGVPNA